MDEVEQEHLELDYVLNHSKDFDVFREQFGVSIEARNVSISTYKHIDEDYTFGRRRPSYTIHTVTFDQTGHIILEGNHQLPYQQKA
jgi:uridine kinase